jgi:hypothetical protein
MSEQIIEKEVEIDSEENEPVYYKPKVLNLMATIAGILSWIVLVGYVADIVIQFMSIQAQLTSQQLALATLLAEPGFNSYIFTNIILPLLSGLTFFVVLQGVAIALNVLLEIDFNTREATN